VINNCPGLGFSEAKGNGVDRANAIAFWADLFS
jgi:hypothetical protein